MFWFIFHFKLQLCKMLTCMSIFELTGDTYLSYCLFKTLDGMTCHFLSV
jgi:hypothetical protein